jgi:release factor glutamine methyltransferase
MLVNSAQVYSPAEDTYLLLNSARREVKPSDRVIEIGSGSGLIAAELVKMAASFVATDINPHAVVHTRAQGIDVVRTNFCAGLSGPFDLIVFNPPYLPTQPEERVDDWLEYALDGGVSGRDAIEQFAADARRVLAPAGRILLLISSLTGLHEVWGIFLSKGYCVAIVQEERVEDETLYVLKIA